MDGISKHKTQKQTLGNGVYDIQITLYSKDHDQDNYYTDCRIEKKWLSAIHGVWFTSVV